MLGLGARTVQQGPLLQPSPAGSGVPGGRSLPRRHGASAPRVVSGPKPCPPLPDRSSSGSLVRRLDSPLRLVPPARRPPIVPRCFLLTAQADQGGLGARLPRVSGARSGGNVPGTALERRTLDVSRNASAVLCLRVPLNSLFSERLSPQSHGRRGVARGGRPRRGGWAVGPPGLERGAVCHQAGVVKILTSSFLLT